MRAAWKDHCDVVKYLTTVSGLNIEERNKKGWTTVIIAAANHNLPMLRILKEAKADMESADHGGFNALLWSSKDGFYEVVKFLIEEANCSANCSDEVILPFFYLLNSD